MDETPKPKRKIGGNNNQNLVAITTEVARERGRNGGLKAAENKRKRKALKEAIKDLLYSDEKAEVLSQINMGLGVGAETRLDVLIAVMYKKARGGDTNAAIKLFEISGMLEPQKIELSGDLSVKSYKDMTTEELKKELEQYERDRAEE